MRVGGKILTGPRTVDVFLPVADGEAVKFTFRPLTSDEKFEDVLSKPEPPEIIKPGNVRFRNTDDPSYKYAIADWVSKKLDWEFLRSITATEGGVEFDSVDLSQPETWGNWRADAEKYFGATAVDAIFGKFMEAQYITEEVMERARASFSNGARKPSE